MIAIFIISIIIYTIGIVIIYHNTYNLEKIEKIKFTLISAIIIFIITIIICNISTKNIQVENEEYLKITKTTAILILSPINLIILVPYLAAGINKHKEKKLSPQILTKRIIITIILTILIAIFEIGYIENFQIGLLQSANKI